MIVVKHVDSIFGSLLPIRLSTFKLVDIFVIHIVVAISLCVSKYVCNNINKGFF